MFGRNKRVVPKKNKVMNRLLTLVIVVVVLIVAGFSMADILKDADFSDVDNVFNVFQALEDGVEEDRVVTYYASTTDELKADSVIMSLGVILSDNSVDFSRASATEDFVLTDKQIGGLINLTFVANTDLEDFELKQLKITQGIGGLSTINSVFMLKATDPFANIYVTTTSTVNEHVQVLSSAVQINEFDEKQNQLVVSALTDMFGENTDVSSYATTYILSSLNTLSTALSMDMTLASGQVQFSATA